MTAAAQHAARASRRIAPWVIDSAFMGVVADWTAARVLRGKGYGLLANISAAVPAALVPSSAPVIGGATVLFSCTSPGTAPAAGRGRERSRPRRAEQDHTAKAPPTGTSCSFLQTRSSPRGTDAR
jgi:hypothetical protein